MAPYQQTKRMAELKAQGGLSQLVLKRFTVTEGISELFEIRIEAVSKDQEQPDIALGDEISKQVEVVATSYGDKKRHFVGVLTEARHLASSEEGSNYLLVVRPKLFLASGAINSKVFANKTLKDVLTELTAKHGQEFEAKFSNTYATMEYLVQYRESDLDFMLRLMEAHGISYHFAFGDGSCKMIATDHAREDVPGGATRQYYPNAQKAPHTEEYIVSWLPQRRYVTNDVKTNDYNFETSETQLTSTKKWDESTPLTATHYEQLFPQALNKETKASPYGTQFAQSLVDMHTSADRRSVATGDAVQLTPGYLMELAGHPNFDGRYLVVRCTHHYDAPQMYRSGGADEANYTGVYELLPEAQNFAPPMITPKPEISGVQTGSVVTAAGAEIDVDKYGRILVHLHWMDAAPNDDDGHTMRARVLQSWAGKGWGTMFIPRKGMEVLVQYVDGDPDRPVVIGCVYNDQQMPAYDLPGDMNVAGWRSRSTKSGGKDNYNELTFDDTKGSELVNFQAEKDLKSLVKNNEDRTVTNNRTTIIEKGNEVETIKMGNEERTLDMGNRTTKLKMGNDDLKLDLGSITHEAMQSITLKVGQSSVVLDQTGVTIKGMMIKIDAQVMLNTNGGAMAEHKAGGMLTIKGGIVMIN